RYFCWCAVFLCRAQKYRTHDDAKHHAAAGESPASENLKESSCDIMRIERATNETCGAATGTVVAIDVIRAFTTAAFALAAGARDIMPVGTVEQALELRARFPGALLMGEVGGYPIEGFDFGNSPSALLGRDLA